MVKGIPVDIHATFEGLEFFGERTPESYGATPETYSTRLADYRNGGVFVSHWGGLGEWERHAQGDEIVMVLEGEAIVYLVIEGQEVKRSISKGELIIVPENTWHRLESEDVKILTVTPRPTDHRVDFPDG